MNKENLIKAIQDAIGATEDADYYVYEALEKLLLYGDVKLIEKMQDVRANLIRAIRIADEILQQIEE